MTKQTRFLAFVIATTACYNAPALTYDLSATDRDAAAPTEREEEDAATTPPREQIADAALPDADAHAPSGDAGRDATREAGPVTVTCTSATYWDTTSAASELMHPGKTCIGCHQATGGPSYTIAGTVYPTMHEPDDCNGVDGTLTGMTILIIDAAGATHTMPVDASGNFKRVTSIPMPYRASVISGPNVREMRTAQTDGDCNGCHSVLGTKSPGRIMAP
jgi:hypothetical protein